MRGASVPKVLKYFNKVTVNKKWYWHRNIQESGHE